MAEDKEVIENVEVVDPLEKTDVITDLVFEGKSDVNLKDIKYMCDYVSEYEGCENCPLNSGKICGFAILLKKFFNDVNNMNELVLTWLKNNPPTSYLMDIKEKIPTVVLDKDFNIPTFCVQNIYGKDCCECSLNDISKFDSSNMLCRRCWRIPISEELKKEYY